MALAHHSNVTLVPFCLCPSFLSSYLLYFLFSCSASSCWQPFLSISLPPSLFLNPALVPAPLLCSLSLLFQAFQPNTSYFPFHLQSGRSPEDRDTSCFILHENLFSIPRMLQGPAQQGELRTREEYRGAADRDTSLLLFHFCWRLWLLPLPSLPARPGARVLPWMCRRFACPYPH